MPQRLLKLKYENTKKLGQMDKLIDPLNFIEFCVYILLEVPKNM